MLVSNKLFAVVSIVFVSLSLHGCPDKKKDEKNKNKNKSGGGGGNEAPKDQAELKKAIQKGDFSNLETLLNGDGKKFGLNSWGGEETPVAQIMKNTKMDETQKKKIVAAMVKQGAKIDEKAKALLKDPNLGLGADFLNNMPNMEQNNGNGH